MLKIWNVEEMNIWSGQGCGLRYPKRKGEVSGGTSRVDSVVREFILIVHLNPSELAVNFQ
jgi:hypothetical protein